VNNVKKRMIFGTLLLISVALLITFCYGWDPESHMQYFQTVNMPLYGMENASCEYDVTKLLESMNATVLSISSENEYVHFRFSLRGNPPFWLREIEKALAAAGFPAKVG
jgi:hypothetical protein